MGDSIYCGRIQEGAQVLQRMLEEDELQDAVLLLFVNKEDLPNAMPISEMTDKLGLYSLPNRTGYVQATCATQRTGLMRNLTGCQMNFQNVI